MSFKEGSITGDNYIRLRGKITRNFTYSHIYDYKEYYKTQVEVMRYEAPGVIDCIPILVPKEAFLDEDISSYESGDLIEVSGRIASYDLHVRDPYGGPKRHHLSIFVTAESIIKIDKVPRRTNKVHITGSICNGLLIKTTKTGRKKAVFFILTRRADGKQDVVPCLAFDELAEYAEQHLYPKAKVNLTGSLTSKPFTRLDPISHEKVESRTAYEVILRKIYLKE